MWQSCRMSEAQQRWPRKRDMDDNSTKIDSALIYARRVWQQHTQCSSITRSRYAASTGHKCLPTPQELHFGTATMK